MAVKANNKTLDTMIENRDQKISKIVSLVSALMVLFIVSLIFGSMGFALFFLGLSIVYMMVALLHALTIISYKLSKTGDQNETK